ncbi:MAG: hypothetical protein ACRD3N_01470 [Terracidiphilus sp.]
MSTNNQFGTRSDAGDERTDLIAAGESAEQDAGVEEALRNFKLSVHAWSEAQYGRPRVAETPIHHRTWRLAAGWAMACVLVAGGAAGGVFEHIHKQQAAAQIAVQAQRARQEQLAAAEQRVHEQDQKLMATVDTEISQEVPSAMEPLADLMEDSGGTQ